MIDRGKPILTRTGQKWSYLDRARTLRDIWEILEKHDGEILDSRKMLKEIGINILHV